MMEDIKLFFAGDFCAKPTTSLISVSDDLRNMIRSCDLKVVNFEVPLKPDVTLPPQHNERFWQNDDAPAFLRDLGFNLFSIANNHAFDWGEAGYLKTKAALGDQAFGAGNYEDAYKVKICEVNGVKVGFMALTYAAYTGVFDDVLHREGLGCAYVHDLRVNHDIVEAKKQVEYLFIMVHDGIEYIDVPLPETIARYRDLIDWGADGVFGSHPHCPQGWEEYKGKPIFYSLGNFFFNSKDDTLYRAWNRPHWYEGVCVMASISSEGFRYQVINTRNVDNVLLLLDNTSERDKHNSKICSYLKTEKDYLDYLYSQCRRLTDSQEMPIIDGTFHENTLKTSTKRLFKSWVKKILGKTVNNNQSLQTLLRNESRKSVLLRGIQNHI